MKKIILMIMFFPGIPFVANAQDTEEEQAEEWIGDPGGDNDVPVDGGWSVLIAAGAGIMVKQLRKKVQKKPGIQSNVRL